jgi:hypothetical protein
MQRVCPVNLGALIYGSTPCIKRLRSTVRHHLHLPPGMSATRPHGIVSAHMVQSRRRPKVTAHTCWASVGAMPAGDQLTGTWPGQMQRLSTVASWSCRRHESSRTRGAAEAGCSGVGCSSRGRRSTRQNAPRPARRVPVGGEVVFVFEGDEVEWMSTRSSTSRLERSRRRSGRCASSSRIRESRRPSTPRKATRTSQSAVSGRDGQQRPATCHRPWWPIADLEHA